MIVRRLVHAVIWLAGVPAAAIATAHTHAGLTGTRSVAAAVPDWLTVALGLLALGLYLGDERYARRRNR